MSYGIKFKWYSTACNEIRFGDKTWVTDPFIDSSCSSSASWKDIEACNYITISHMHYDHIPQIPQLQKAHGAKVLLADLEAKEFATWSDIAPHRLYPMSVGMKINFGDITFEAVYGHHTALGKTYAELLNSPSMNAYIDEYCGGDPGLKSLNGWGCISYRNWLATLPDGTRILIWGGFPTTEDINLVKEIQPDIMFTQCTGAPADKLAKLCTESGARVIIPQHMDFPAVNEASNMAHLAELQDKLEVPGSTQKIVLPQKNSWVEL